MNLPRTVAFVALTWISAACATARPPVAHDALTPQRDRVTDESMRRDFGVFDALGDRIARLDRTMPDSYELTKAREWLTVSRFEYEANDRTGIVETAYERALNIVRALETGAQTESFVPAPDLPGTSLVRQDLWDRVTGARRSGLRSPELARLEVHLVWAGNEELTCEVDDPRPIQERAASMALDFTTLVVEEEPEPAVIVPPIEVPQAVVEPPPPVAPPAPTREMLRLPSVVHFAFDSDSLTAATRDILDVIVGALRDRDSFSIALVGHTDVRGDEGYNDDLSRRRVRAVFEYLQRAGLSAHDTVQAVGESAPMVSAETEVLHATNRRVEIRYRWPEERYEVELYRPTADLQPIERR